MAFQLKLADGEVVQGEAKIVVSNKLSMLLVLTNKGAYWPGKKVLAVSDAVTTRQAPIAQIQKIVFKKRSPLGSLIIGLLLIVGGGLWTLAGYFGAPQALIVGGIIVAVVGGRRRVLEIHTERRCFSWKEPISFGGSLKNKITETFKQVSAWAASNGIKIEGAAG